MYLFAWFMNTMLGRWVRFVGGAAMVIGGLAGLGGLTGVVVAVIGLIPLAAGAFDICVLAPALGTPFGGAKVRAFLNSRRANAGGALTGR